MLFLLSIGVKYYDVSGSLNRYVNSSMFSMIFSNFMFICLKFKKFFLFLNLYLLVLL